MCSAYLFVCGVHTNVKSINFDYSEYLGADYNLKLENTKRTSTIVSNHISWIDPIVMIKTLRSAFAPNSGLKNIPIVKTLCDCLDSIYIRRGGTEEQVSEALKVIKDRQDKIEQSEHYNPLLLFPEGGTTNGKQLMKFRKGAFFSEKTVKPIFIKYVNSTLSVAFDTIEFLPLAILMLSWGCTTCHITILPDFKPNDHLFKKHADKGDERWQVYAWAVRDVI